jgi:hypothetical protein
LDNDTGQTDMPDKDLPGDQQAELELAENPESNGETVSSDPWRKFRFDRLGGLERRTISPYEDGENSTAPRRADGEQM